MATSSVADALESAVKEALLPQLPSSYAFGGVSVKNGGALVGDYMEARIQSQPLIRTVLLQYFPASESGPSQVELILQRHRHERISMRWLATRENDQSQSSYPAGTESVSRDLHEKIHAYCMTAMESNKLSLRPILEGLAWPEIPFDFQGHK
jgi:hypothetical protein